MNRLSVKVMLLYILIAVINIAFFAIFIFENQADLISENAKLQTKELANDFYFQLNKEVEQINSDPGEYETVAVILNRMQDVLNTFQSSHTLFKEDGTIYFSTIDGFSVEEHRAAVVQAVYQKEVKGNFYYYNINDTSLEIFFYVPLNIRLLDDVILMYRLDSMKEKYSRLETLFRLILIVIGCIALFHIIFGFILNRIVVSPIKLLATRSMDLSRGNLDTRVSMKRRDEIGYLGTSFNTMAESIQDKITKLDQKNKQMLKEMEMASHVQESIYPRLKETESFYFSVYHNPLFAVSGDYHDVFSLENGDYGILVADVSGHGVSAALITMLMKDLFSKTASGFTDSKDLMCHINSELGNLMVNYDHYFTAFYFILTKDKKLNYVNAGHQKSILIRPGKKGVYMLDTDGIIIGISKNLNPQISSKELTAKKGDKIILYTDGISESLSSTDEEFGTKRLLRTAYKHSKSSCDEMLVNMVADFHVFVDPDKRRDDETLIVIEVK